MTYDADIANAETHAAWEANAEYWDGKIDEGNDFVNLLVWPATQRLLDVQHGECVLDAACGNGLYARKLAALGANVVAFDFSERLIALAREREAVSDRQLGVAGSIAYHVIDAMDEAAMLALGERAFDAAICQMALFDIADIDPLMRAVARLLKPGGCFVFSVVHPCFNTAHTVRYAEQEDVDGEVVTTYGVKVTKYLSTTSRRGVAIRGQPQAQWYFDRSLQTLFGAAFDAGFVLDALEEPGFPPEHRSGPEGLSWGGNLSEIPPVLVVRMRKV
jgi:SAM-dependent methyltransferase